MNNFFNSAPELSIIIPVYNVEGYLHRCVDSILSQDYDAYEIILVDDGSTDSSGAICDEFAKRHTHISVIHKPNGGLRRIFSYGIRTEVAPTTYAAISYSLNVYVIPISST